MDKREKCMAAYGHAAQADTFGLRTAIYNDIKNMGVKLIKVRDIQVSKRDSGGVAKVVRVGDFSTNPSKWKARPY